VSFAMPAVAAGIMAKDCHKGRECVYPFATTPPVRGASTRKRTPLFCRRGRAEGARACAETRRQGCVPEDHAPCPYLRTTGR